MAVNTALKCQLRGGTSPKLSASVREGTGFAFLRFEAGFTTGSPQVTLARMDLKSGATLFRRLPTGIAQGPYELVTTPPGDLPLAIQQRAGAAGAGTH